MTDKVRFTLPVGAYFGGAYHLGGGVFVAYRDETPPVGPMQRIPRVLEGVVTNPDAQLGPYTCEPYVDPLDSEPARYRQVMLLEPQATTDAALAALAD